MLTGKHLSCATKTSGHFIGDHQDMIFIAEEPSLFEISLGEDDHPSCSLNHGFQDKGCHFGVMFLHRFLKKIETFHPAVRIGSTERTSKTIGGLYSKGTKEQRFVNPMEEVDSPYRSEEHTSELQSGL